MTRDIFIIFYWCVFVGHFLCIPSLKVCQVSLHNRFPQNIATGNNSHAARSRRGSARSSALWIPMKPTDHRCLLSMSSLFLHVAFLSNLPHVPLLSLPLTPARIRTGLRDDFVTHLLCLSSSWIKCVNCHRVAECQNNKDSRYSHLWPFSRF